MISKAQHEEFYSWQIALQEEEWQRYCRNPMNTLYQNGRLFPGLIWGYEPVSGGLILRFKGDSVPRMKNMYCLCVVGSAAGSNPKEWTFTYEQFRSSSELSRRNTECHTEFILSSDDSNYRYIGVTGLDVNFVNEMKERYLDQRQHPIMVLAETDPPLKYLLNLKEYVQRQDEATFSKILYAAQGKQWQPGPLDNEQEALPILTSHFIQHDQLILQGPPGTGKSFLVAQICAHYAQQGCTVVVTTLTNKALMEVTEKEGLQGLIQQKKVYKTSLSSDEQKRTPTLQMATDLQPLPGEVLLSTYYKLSDLLNPAEKQQIFDFLIIEEASQAYLASIVGFAQLAKQVLVVGDQQQLPPVILKREEASRIHLSLSQVMDGLNTYALGHMEVAKRLIKTRRLSTAGAKFTGLFYDNQLLSIAPKQITQPYQGQYQNFFDKEGGVSLVKLPVLDTKLPKSAIIQLHVDIAVDMLQMSSNLEIALLNPYVEIEKSWHSAYSRKASSSKRITISTIHRIQGLTCDYTILYLPLNNPGIELEEHLFNVATSRARYGTLIITSSTVEWAGSTSPRVRSFLAATQDVTEAFLAHWSLPSTNY